jgi:hypothetical protein
MGASAAHRAPKMVPRMVHGNGDKKGAERGIATKASDGAGQSDERVLDQILHGAFVSKQPLSEGTHVLVMCIVDFAESQELPSTYTGDELPLWSDRVRTHEGERYLKLSAASRHNR